VVPRGKSQPNDPRMTLAPAAECAELLMTSPTGSNTYLIGASMGWPSRVVNRTSLPNSGDAGSANDDLAPGSFGPLLVFESKCDG
jgi:hypothetical protein